MLFVWAQSEWYLSIKQSAAAGCLPRLLTSLSGEERFYFYPETWRTKVWKYWAGSHWHWITIMYGLSPMCNQKPESPHWIPAEAEGSVAPRLLSQNEVPKRLTSCGRARREEEPAADDCSQYQVDTGLAPPQHPHQHNLDCAASIKLTQLLHSSDPEPWLLLLGWPISVHTEIPWVWTISVYVWQVVHYLGATLLMSLKVGCHFSGKKTTTNAKKHYNLPPVLHILSLWRKRRQWSGHCRYRLFAVNILPAGCPPTQHVCSAGTHEAVSTNSALHQDARAKLLQLNFLLEEMSVCYVDGAKEDVL